MAPYTNDSFLKSQIKNIAPADLIAAGVLQLANDKKSPVCPLCGNGTGKSGDGLAVKHYSWGYSHKCFKCGESFDNIKLLALYYGLDTRADFKEILNRAAADFGIATGNFPANSFADYHNLQPTKTILPPKKNIEEVEKECKLKALYLRLTIKDLGTPDNLEKISEYNRRGLTVETLRYFKCIYVENWIHPKNRAEYKLGICKNLPPASRRILIPSFGGSHYVAVLVKSDRNEEYQKYWKQHTAGKSDFFGVQTLTADTECVFIYEGEFNAMTAFQAWKENNFLRESMNIFEVDTAENLTSGENISADFIPYSAFLAVGGVAESNWIEYFDKKCKEFGIAPRVIINFDKDKAGKDGASKVQKELRARGYLTAINFIEGAD